MKLPADEIDEIIDNVQFSNENPEMHKINYSQFLAATISVKKVLNDDMLLALFKHFDIDNSDFITRTDIIGSMAKYS